MKLLSVLTLGAAVSFSSIAYAQVSDTKPFSGFAVGVTGGVVTGKHTIDLEVLGYTVPIANDSLSGSSLGLSLEYLYPISDWRVGPRLKLQQSSFEASDRIGNKYVNFETSLQLDQMHTLGVMIGYVATPRLMPYAFLGVAASEGTIGARLNVLQYSVADSTTGWVAGPAVGIGALYRLSKHSELGVEYTQASFKRSYTKCAKIAPQYCATVPLAIKPQMLSVTYQYRF